MAVESAHDETALRAKVAAWQAALDAYLAAKAIDGPVGDLAHNGSPVGAMAASSAFDLPMGALRKKSVPDAITLYLSAGHRKQTNKEIANGILAGGLETGAKNLEASVAATLFRLKKAGIVLRFADGWDLAEHYVGFDGQGVRLDEKLLRERIASVLADQKRIGDVIQERTHLDNTQVEGLFREAQTKDASYAVGCGIVNEIRDVNIPAGEPVISLIFQR